MWGWEFLWSPYTLSEMWKQQRGKDCLSNRLQGLQLPSPRWAAGGGTHAMECLWHRGLFQLMFSWKAMPGDIFVFIARAGSCLQVLIIDRSSSTREPVCEPPSTLPGSHYRVPSPSLQLAMSCLGWPWWHRWCHLWQALPAGQIPGSWEVIHSGEKPKSICTYTRLPRLTNNLWLLPRPALGLMDLQTTEVACSALNMAQTKFGRKKSFIILPKNRAAWFPRSHRACRSACLTHNNISCPLRGSPERLSPLQMNIYFLQGFSLAAPSVPDSVMAGWFYTQVMKSRV